LLRKRLTRASEELNAVAEYDYAIVNEDLVTAVTEVSAILDGKAEEHLVSRQQNLPGVIERLRRDVVKAAEKI
jgi:guanylate kinase